MKSINCCSDIAINTAVPPCDVAPVSISKNVRVYVDSLYVQERLQEAIRFNNLELVNEIINGSGCKIEYV